MDEQQPIPEQAKQEGPRYFIGGSDAGVIAGVSPYKTALELYYEKTGGIDVEDISAKPAVHFGNLLEDVIATEYARQRGVNVRRSNRTFRHRVYNWMAANVDRMIDNAEGGLECKNTGAFRLDEWGEAETDQVPAAFLLQCQHYMEVTSRSWWDLAVLIHGNSFRIYHIPRDDELIGNLIDLEKDFWSHVEARIPPEPGDMTARPKSYIDLFKKLYHGTSGEIVPAGPGLLHWHFVRQQAASMVSQYEAVRDGASAHILASMGDAAAIQFPDGSGYTRKLIKRKGYSVEPNELIDFRFVKQIKGEK